MLIGRSALVLIFMNSPHNMVLGLGLVKSRTSKDHPEPTVKIFSSPRFPSTFPRQAQSSIAEREIPSFLETLIIVTCATCPLASERKYREVMHLSFGVTHSRRN